MRKVSLFGLLAVALMGLSACSDDKDNSTNLPNPDMVGAWDNGQAANALAAYAKSGNPCAVTARQGMSLMRVEANGAVYEMKSEQMVHIGTMNAYGTISLNESEKDVYFGRYADEKNYAQQQGLPVLAIVNDQATLSIDKRILSRVTTPTLSIEGYVMPVKKSEKVYSKLQTETYDILLSAAQECSLGSRNGPGRRFRQNDVNDRFDNRGRFDQRQEDDFFQEQGGERRRNLRGPQRG